MVLSSVVELAVDCKKGAGLSRINNWKRPTNVTMQREVCLSTRKSSYDFSQVIVISLIKNAEDDGAIGLTDF